jgi:hypothetical protein
MHSVHILNSDLFAVMKTSLLSVVSSINMRLISSSENSFANSEGLARIEMTLSPFDSFLPAHWIVNELGQNRTNLTTNFPAPPFETLVKCPANVSGESRPTTSAIYMIKNEIEMKILRSF